MKSYINTGMVFLTLFLVLIAGSIEAATVKGSVKDELGRPIAGVKVAAGKTETLTDENGLYQLNLREGTQATLDFSKSGFSPRTLKTSDTTPVSVVLKKDMIRRNDIVNLGYTTQSRNSVSGALSTVDGEALSVYPTLNLLQTLPGNLTGMIYFESDNNLFNSSVGLASRGISTLSGTRNLLIVIDGIVSTTQDYRYIQPQEIENITYLKDASCTTLYGIQGANGVLIITTKRGQTGRTQVKVRLNTALQQMTNRPLSVDSWEYATLRNQAAYNDNHSVGQYSQFSEEDIAGFRKGGDYYPNNNWVDKYLRKVTTMQRLGIDVAGGSEKIRYYSMIGYDYQSSQFRTDDAQTKYNSQPELHIFKARTNLDMNFTKYLTGFANLSANISSNRMPIAPSDGGAENSSLIYGRLQNMPATTYGPTTLHHGKGAVVATEKETTPVYGILNRSGYNILTSTNFSAQAGLKLDLGFWLKGLSLSGKMAFQGTATQSQYNTITYQRQLRDLSNGYTDLSFTNYGSEVDGTLQNNNIGVFTYDLNYYGMADYVRTFGRHSVKVNAYAHYLKQVLANSTSGVEVMPYIRHTVGAELQYGYDERYFVKGDFAYSGSDQFAHKNRYAALPSVSVAWVATNEAFLKDSPWLTYLKLRASYGITANDQFTGGGRFLYLDYISAYGGENLIGNPNLYAERLRNQNYGFDLGLWNHWHVSFDYFIAHNNKMLISTNNFYPLYMGATNTSISNKGRMKNQGFEVNVDYSKEFTKDWGLTVGAGLSHSKNKVLYTNELKNIGYYKTHRQDGYAAGSIFGYRVDYKATGNGFINTQEQLEQYAPLYVAGGLGTPRLGDLIYKDLNKDGRIGVEDMDKLGCSIPEYYYSLSAAVHYRSLKLYVQFEGAAKSKDMMILAPNRYDGIYTDLHRKAWTPERYAAGKEITYPALYVGNSTSNANSDYFLNNTAYLSLRNVTLSYALPEKVARKIGAHAINLSLTGENLWTLDDMKSDYYDPRVRSTSAFQPYRIINLGVDVTF